MVVSFLTLQGPKGYKGQMGTTIGLSEVNKKLYILDKLSLTVYILARESCEEAYHGTTRSGMYTIETMIYNVS